MGTKRQKLSFDYKLHGQTLDTVDHHQYLGIFLSLSHKFKWDFQYNHIAKKANQVLGMLRRNLRRCSRSIKSTAYLALVRSNLEYASSVCDPHESKYINKLEMIYHLNFPLQLILIIPGVKLLIVLWLFHLGKIILGKENFITGQASYGTIYQMIYVIIVNQWACSLLKKFWLLYNELYCVSYVYFIYLNFIAFPKG